MRLYQVVFALLSTFLCWKVTWARLFQHQETPASPKDLQDEKDSSTGRRLQRDDDFPYVRYQFYEDLDGETLEHVRDLDYVEGTWNQPGTNDIELLSYESLEDELLSDSVDALGISEDAWDCHISHYEDYDWEELAEDVS